LANVGSGTAATAVRPATSTTRAPATLSIVRAGSASVCERASVTGIPWAAGGLRHATGATPVAATATATAATATAATATETAGGATRRYRLESYGLLRSVTPGVPAATSAAATAVSAAPTSAASRIRTWRVQQVAQSRSGEPEPVAATATDGAYAATTAGHCRSANAPVYR
jgi:hypothetical protein